MENKTSGIKLMIRECIDALDQKLESRFSSINEKLDKIINNELVHLASDIVVMKNDISWIMKSYDEIKKSRDKNGNIIDKEGISRDIAAQTNIDWLKDIFWKVILPTLAMIVGAAVGHFLFNK